MLRTILTFGPILIAASWALYNIFFLIRKSIPNSIHGNIDIEANEVFINDEESAIV